MWSVPGTPSRRVYIRRATDDNVVRSRSAGGQDVQQACGTFSIRFTSDFQRLFVRVRPGRNPHQALDALTVGIQNEARETGYRRGYSELFRPNSVTNDPSVRAIRVDRR